MIVAACCLTGLLWRAEGLLRRSFWIDEVLTVLRARQPTVESLLADLESVPFPPLYYLMLWGWARIWGAGELPVRALPLVIGVVTVPVTYVVWAGLTGRKNALWATALLSTNAFHVFYSQDAKMYAAVWLLATVTSAAFLHAQAAGPRQWDWLVLYGVSNAALLQVSYVGVVPMAIQFLYGLLAISRVRPIAGKLATTAALSWLPCLAWLPITLRTVTQRTGISWIPPVDRDRIASEVSDALGYYVLGYRVTPDYSGDLWSWFFSSLCGPAKWLAGAVILVHLIRLVRRRNGEGVGKAPVLRESDTGLYLALWAFLPAVGAFLFSITVYPIWGPPRYLMASGPAVILLLGCALGSLKQQALACVVAAVFIALNAAMIVFEKTHVTSDPYRQMVRIAATFARGSPGLHRDPSLPSEPLSIIHVAVDRPFSDFSPVCVQYEIEEVNVTSRTRLLRLNTIQEVVNRPQTFFVVYEFQPHLSETAARAMLEARILSRRAGGEPRARRYELSRAFSAEVRADGPLPTPLMSHTAQLWICSPTSS